MVFFASSTITKPEKNEQIISTLTISFGNIFIWFTLTVAKKLFDKSLIFHIVVWSSKILILLWLISKIVMRCYSSNMTHWGFFMKLNLLSIHLCDNFMQKFLEFVALEIKLRWGPLQPFQANKNWFDMFSFKYTDVVKYKELSSVLKVLLNLYHYQADVERWFNINNLLLKLNIFD